MDHTLRTNSLILALVLGLLPMEANVGTDYHFSSSVCIIMCMVLLPEHISKYRTSAVEK